MELKSNNFMIIRVKIIKRVHKTYTKAYRSSQPKFAQSDGVWIFLGLQAIAQAYENAPSFLTYGMLKKKNKIDYNMPRNHNHKLYISV